MNYVRGRIISSQPYFIQDSYKQTGFGYFSSGLILRKPFSGIDVNNEWPCVPDKYWHTTMTEYSVAIKNNFVSWAATLTYNGKG